MQPLLDAPPAVQPYESGSWGPPAARETVLPDYPGWREPWLGDHRCRASQRAQSRAGVADLIGDRPLSARSVLATALLGADEPHLTVGELVGDRLAVRHQRRRRPHLPVADGLQRRTRPATTAPTRSRGRCSNGGNASTRPPGSTTPSRRRGIGTWELAVVSLDRRSAADRLALRKAATALHLAELREGIWIRPDNLDPDRLPTLRAVLDRQCVHFHGAATDIPPRFVRSLFNLDDWADRRAAAHRRHCDDELRRSKRSTPTTSPISSRCPSPSSGISSSTRCCPPSSSRTTGPVTICAAPTVTSTRCSNATSRQCPRN